ncbi:MAG: RidA family protein [Chloroflexi bacterium]|nr:RidA family protein [Chloroflexota bacterium]
MEIRRVNPSSIHPPASYSHAVGVTDGTLWYLAGQVALDAEGNLVGEGDLRAQADQAFANIKAILTELAADWSNVVKLTIYVVNYQPAQHRPILVHVLHDVFDRVQPPANTLLGIQSLARPGMMIEVEAVVAIAT